MKTNITAQVDALWQGQGVDFAACLDVFPVLEQAKTTPQDPVYHGEGDVWTHTQMVVSELLALADFQAASESEQRVLFLAALLHDVAKYRTTVINEQGRISQPGHSKKGALDARIVLWELGLPFAEREAVCSLIAVHQVPFFAFEDNRHGHTPQWLCHSLSWQTNIRLLCALAEADMHGRVCADKSQALDNIALLRELAREEGCEQTPKAFANEHTRLRYFQGHEVYPDFALQMPQGSRVTLMCGLPASGKNTWVAQHAAGVPVLSYDDTRQRLGLKYGANEGLVAHTVLEEAKAHLRAKQDFVWNATHLSAQMRQKNLATCFAYDAHVRMVYVEADKATLLKRNHVRDSSLSNAKLLQMLKHWEMPTKLEAHQLTVLGDAGQLVD
mgnify:FL=1